MDKKQLQRLTAKWQRKLERSGFRDIERPNGGLKRYDSFYFQMEYSPTAFQAREKYYRLANILLHTHQFRTRRQRQVWELHCKGYTQEAIGRRLRIPRRTISDILASVAELIKKPDTE